jgi:hypothetical protein
VSIESMIFGVAANAITELLTKKVEVSTEEKKTYSDKLENATGDDIFKYILLINISALDGYVAQTRIQAQQSFQLSKIVAIIGFIILSIAIGLSIFLTMSGNANLNAAYLSSVAGIVTEFIAGVFFYLYNKTLQQINLFHDKLVMMQQTSMSYIATGLVSDQAKKDQAKIDLSNKFAEIAKPASSK